jgi:transcriptional regulator with XRE-family HTH domain
LRDIFRSDGWSTCSDGASPRETRTGIIALPFCHIKREGKRPQNPAYPKSLTAIGDHIKKRRLDLGLFQKQAAAQIGADEMTICHWELGLTEPEIRFIPKIIEFLGYNPLPEARTFAEQIIRGRKTLGLSQAQLSRRLGVDPGTLSRWETGNRRPKGKHLRLIQQWLGQMG